MAHLAAIHIEHRHRLSVVRVIVGQLDCAWIHHAITLAADFATIQIQRGMSVRAIFRRYGNRTARWACYLTAALAVADVQRGIAFHRNHGI